MSQEALEAPFRKSTAMLKWFEQDGASVFLEWLGALLESERKVLEHSNDQVEVFRSQGAVEAFSKVRDLRTQLKDYQTGVAKGTRNRI